MRGRFSFILFASVSWRYPAARPRRAPAPNGERPLKTMPLETLFTDLEAEFARDPRGPGVARLLEAYSKSEDWREYAVGNEPL